MSAVNQRGFFKAGVATSEFACFQDPYKHWNGPTFYLDMNGAHNLGRIGSSHNLAWALAPITDQSKAFRIPPGMISELDFCDWCHSTSEMTKCSVTRVVWYATRSSDCRYHQFMVLTFNHTDEARGEEAAIVSCYDVVINRSAEKGRTARHSIMVSVSKSLRHYTEHNDIILGMDINSIREEIPSFDGEDVPAFEWRNGIQVSFLNLGHGLSGAERPIFCTPAVTSIADRQWVGPPMCLADVGSILRAVTSNVIRPGKLSSFDRCYYIRLVMTAIILTHYSFKIIISSSEPQKPGTRHALSLLYTQKQAVRVPSVFGYERDRLCRGPFKTFMYWAVGTAPISLMGIYEGLRCRNKTILNPVLWNCVWRAQVTMWFIPCISMLICAAIKLYSFEDTYDAATRADRSLSDIIKDLDRRLQFIFKQTRDLRGLTIATGRLETLPQAIEGLVLYRKFNLRLNSAPWPDVSLDAEKLIGAAKLRRKWTENATHPPLDQTKDIRAEFEGMSAVQLTQSITHPFGIEALVRSKDPDAADVCIHKIELMAPVPNFDSYLLSTLHLGTAKIGSKHEFSRVAFSYFIPIIGGNQPVTALVIGALVSDSASCTVIMETYDGGRRHSWHRINLSDHKNEDESISGSWRELSFSQQTQDER